MNCLMILVATASLGIEVGWEPLPDGGYEYTIQLEPQLLQVLESGKEEIFSDVPAGIDVRRYRIVVGVGKLRRETGSLGYTPAASPAAAQPAYPPAVRTPAASGSGTAPAANPYAQSAPVGGGYSSEPRNADPEAEFDADLGQTATQSTAPPANAPIRVAPDNPRYEASPSQESPQPAARVAQAPAIQSPAFEAPAAEPMAAPPVSDPYAEPPVQTPPGGPPAGRREEAPDATLPDFGDHSQAVPLEPIPPTETRSGGEAPAWPTEAQASATPELPGKSAARELADSAPKAAETPLANTPAEPSGQGQAEILEVTPGASTHATGTAPGKLASATAASEPIPKATFEAEDSNPSGEEHTTGLPVLPEGLPVERPWGAMVVAIVLLGCSVGANIYLGWVALEARARYRSAIAKYRGATA